MGAEAVWLVEAPPVNAAKRSFTDFVGAGSGAGGAVVDGDGVINFAKSLSSSESTTLDVATMGAWVPG